MTPHTTTELPTLIAQCLSEVDLTQYHEAGHAVAYHFLGFHPKRITGPLTEHDRRSTAFFRTRGGFLETPLARERVQDYAVSCIAGIAAESKVSAVPLADLRQTSGRGDYKTVHAILNRLMIGRGLEFCPEVRAAYLNLWESRAVALMNHSQVWAAVESVSAELQMSCGELDRGELVAAIERGMHQG
jgi:hypothetical protein